MTSIQERLAEPFRADEVKWLPKGVKGNRAAAIAYVSARAIMDRLDEVFGVDGWSDEYTILPDGSALCQLKMKFPDGTWVTKTDVGTPSEQPDGGDRLKAAVSDGLKRAAVKAGIARYLYKLPMQWADYDPAKKQFSQVPHLPAWALPKGSKPEQAAPRQNNIASIPPVESKPATPANLPATGRELVIRLRDFNAKLAQEGRAELGALIASVEKFGQDNRFDADLNKWGPAEIAKATQHVNEFVKKLPPAQKK